MSITLDSSIKQIDDFNPWIEYAPIASTVYAGAALFNKYFYLPAMSSESIANSRYYTHLNNTSYARHLTLLVPVIGNVTIILLDCMKQTNSPTQNVNTVLDKPSSPKEVKKIIIPDKVNNKSFIPFTDNWTGNEDYLFFHANLIVEGLELPKNFSFTIKSHESTCEFIIKPKEGYSLVSANGNELQHLKIILKIENNNNDSKRLSCKLVSELFYKNKTSGETVITTTMTDKIKNPPLDFSHEPQFCVKGTNELIVSFKNSFPYSQL